MQSLQRDGVYLCFEEAGSGAPPIVLVHGWCCDHTYFAPQFDHFARQGHRTVAVDLRGHGRSDKPRQPYTMPGFADDVAWICTQLRLTKPVIIGHSMGGIVTFDLAARYPDLPAAIVMIDAAVVLPAATRANVGSFLDALRGQNYRAVLSDYVTNVLFLATDDRDRKTRILEAMTSAPRHVMVSAFEGLRNYDPDIAKTHLVVPSLYIAANETLPRSDMVRLHELVPPLHYGQTVGSGHFCQLEVPEQVDTMIDRFLEIALPASA